MITRDVTVTIVLVDGITPVLLDLLVDTISDDELRAALARAREIRSLADFDARTAEIATQSTARST